MGKIVELRPDSFINASSLATHKLPEGMILPASQPIQDNVVKEHDAQPIKSVEDIMRISEYLIKEERYRDNMLFVLGINFGLRISDLLKLRFTNLIDDNLVFRTTFAVFEQKTSNTRKVKRNRYVTINEAVIEAVTLYLRHNQCKLDDYVFRGESNRSNPNAPMTRGSADRILKGIANELHLRERVSTHTLRKTFGYHQMVMSGNSQRKLLLLQKMFGHSSAGQTLDYIGITSEEIEDAYLNLNLGSKNNYMALFGEIVEHTVA